MAKKETRELFFKKELTDELIEISLMMKNEKNVEKRLYYYSAAYGVTQRTLRSSFTKDLLLLDMVLSTSYNLLTDRLNHIKAGDQLVPLDVLNKAVSYIIGQLDNVSTSIKAGSDYTENLENILVATYSATGNGNFLLERGLLKY